LVSTLTHYDRIPVYSTYTHTNDWLRTVRVPNYTLSSKITRQIVFSTTSHSTGLPQFTIITLTLTHILNHLFYGWTLTKHVLCVVSATSCGFLFVWSRQRLSLFRSLSLLLHTLCTHTQPDFITCDDVSWWGEDFGFLFYFPFCVNVEKKKFMQISFLIRFLWPSRNILFLSFCMCLCRRIPCYCHCAL